MQRFAFPEPERGRVRPPQFLPALVAVLLALAGGAALAQPANDNLLTPEILEGPMGVVTGDSGGATAEVGEPPHCGYPAAASVWYAWRAPYDGMVQFDAFGSAIDTVLSVYTGNSNVVSRLTQVAANDYVLLQQGYWNPSAVKFMARADTTYYIAVDDYDGAGGAISLAWGYASAGVFRFTVDTYFIGENDLNGSVSPDPFGTGRSVVGMLVTVTRVAGSSGRVLVDYDFMDGAAVNFVDYFGFPGTLEFEDEEMSKSFIVYPLPDGGIRAENRDFAILLTGATLDPLESADLVPPRLDPDHSLAVGVVLDADLEYRGQVDAEVQMPIVQFSKLYYRTTEHPSGNYARVYVERTGTNNVSTKIRYTAISTPTYTENGQLNTFNLNAGSDYATPEPPDTAPPGVAGDFTIASGELNWAENDYQPKYFDVPIITNDTRVEFNEDILLQIYVPPGSTDGWARPGQAFVSWLTILYNEFPAGQVDTAFNQDYSLTTVPPGMSNPGSDSTVYGMLPLSNGRIILVGDFRAYNNRAANRIVRANEDGAFDLTFAAGSGADGIVSCIAPLAGGGAVIGGGFTSYNGQFRRGVAKIGLDGALDAGFNPGQGANAPVWAVAVASGDKIYIAGEFTSVNNQPRPYVARLNADGSLDPAFAPAVGPNGPVYALAVATGDKLFIGGEFTAVGGVSRNGIARLNADGTLDTGFDPLTGVDAAVYALVAQPDGKPLLGGAFKTFNQVPRAGLARLTATGALDPTFDPGSGADDTVFSITPAPGGKLLIGGLFTTFNGTRRLGFARLYGNGKVDTTFLDSSYSQFAGLPRHYWNEEVEPKNFVMCSALHTDGGVLIGGQFGLVGGGRLSTANQSTVNDAEPYTRAAYRARKNFAKLLGGETPGPGNIGFYYDTYSIGENASFLFVTLLRENGTLGSLMANVAMPEPSAGPGVAQCGLDYAYYALPPVYALSWPDTRTKSDGLWSTNNVAIDVLDRLVGVTAPVYIIPTNDTVIQGNRGVAMEMSVPAGADQYYLGGENIPLGAALGRQTATLTVVDDDNKRGVLGFATPEYWVSESVSNAVITLTRTNGDVGAVSVRFETTTGGTATAGTDYTVVSAQTVTFGDGQVEKTVQVPIRNDSTIEQDETVNLRLYNPGGGATLGLTNAVLTIIDDDYLPGRINFTTTAYATNEDAGAALITVTRTGGNLGVVSVQVRTANGTAVTPDDYTGVTNILTWNNGDTSPRTFLIPIVNDGLVEPDETVFLRLLNPTNNGAPASAVLGLRTNATLTLRNTDFYGALQFNLADYPVKENGGYATVTVTRRSGSAEAVSVGYTTANGTALAGVDYTAVQGTLVFPPGQTALSFDVPILNNGDADGSRFFTVSLSNPGPAGSTLGLPNPALVTIQDDESINEPAGSADTDFTPQPGLNGDVFGLALQADGRVVAVGDFTLANNATRTRLARFLSNGSLDRGFTPTGSGANASVRAVINQTDQRLVIGGRFTTVHGVNRNYLARLNYDGTVDTSFDPGSAADNPVFALAETFTGDGRKIVAGGSFTTFNGVPRNGIVQLNDNGSVDAGFHPGLGVDGTVYAIAVYPTNTLHGGKIVIGGDFTLVNGVSRHGIARLNANGTLDLTFDPGTGADDVVRAVAIQLDGKVLLGGAFASVHGTPLNRFARLTDRGAVDPVFQAGVGADGTVFSIAVQDDTRIVLAGEFTTASGVTRHRITRLMSDGTVDPFINFGSGANNFIAAVVLQPDQKILIGGGFTEVDGQARHRLARLYGGSIVGAGSFEFTSAFFGAVEGATNGVVTVRRSGGTLGPLADGSVTVDFITTDGTARAPTNYTDASTPLTFPLGETYRSVLVPIVDDVEINSDRSVNLSLANPLAPAQVGNQAFAALIITNDDSAVSFSSATYTRNENAIDGVATILVRRTGSPLGTATVEFLTTTNGTATPGLDFIGVTNTLTFGPDETTVQVFIPIINDALVEGPETVQMVLTNPVGTLLLEPATALLTIVDDDSAPGQLLFAAAGFQVGESDGQALITVLRTNGRAGTVTAQFSTAPGTATPGLDYVATNGAVVFGDGETVKSFAVTILPDLLVEGPEALTITLANPTGGATLTGSNTVPLVIIDDDVGIGFSSPAYIAREDDGSVTLTVLRANGSNGVTTVQYATTNATATAGLDYTATAGELRFNDGETAKTLTIPILEDTLIEGEENFTVQLSAPSGGAQLMTPSAANVVIVDNDAGFHFTNATLIVTEGVTNAAVTILRTNPAAGTVLVSYSTADGTAVAGADFQQSGGVLVFTNGEVARTILIPIYDDTAVEGEEYFTVSLSNPSPGTQILTPSTLTIVIEDNDAGLRFSQSAYSVGEAGVSASITVLRENFLSNTVAVTYATQNGTATAGQDYVAATGQLVFTNGETAKSFTVLLVDDTVIEGDETILLKLSAPIGAAALVSPSAATLTIVDNDGSLISPAGTILTGESGPVNNIIDPGETVTNWFAFRNLAGVDTTNLVATLLATNGVTAPSAAQNYGALVLGGASVSRQFSFTASGTNGQPIAATFRLRDGTLDLGLVAFNFTLGTRTTSFTNASLVTINDNAVAAPYPSALTVSGLDGVVSKVTVTLTNLSHRSPDDVDVLLAGPAGNSAVLMSDAGGVSALNNVTLTFDDAAAAGLPDSTQITSGVWKPTNYLLGDIFPSPAPQPPYGETLGAFYGSNPNGTWGLYIVDDYPFDSGALSNGWILRVTTAAIVTPVSDLSVTMSASPVVPIVTSNFTYTLMVTNHGPATNAGVAVVDTLPAGVAYVSAAPSSGTVSTNGNGVVTWALGALAKDGRATLTLTVKALASGVVTNTATVSGLVTEANAGNNTATLATVVSPIVADLAVSLVDAPDPVAVGGTLTYSVTVLNLGPATATAVRLTNTLPSGVTFVSAHPANGVHSNGRVTFDLGDVGSGATRLATVVARPTLPGIVTGIASVGAGVPDPLKGNNTASVKTVVEFPTLSVARAGNELVLSWPATGGYVLESTVGLSPASWTEVPIAPEVVGGVSRVRVPLSGAGGYFRLRWTGP